MGAATKLSEQELDATFAALADGTRRAIVKRLSAGEASVLELAEPFAMSQPAISKHLKVLERAGLITRSRDAQRRPCRLEPQRLQQLSEWLGGYRKFWEQSYDRLDDFLQELQAQPNKTKTETKTQIKKEKKDGPQTRSHRRPR